ncbi:MAG: GNAT family N-acetyltransferase, partial [Calditrichaeota bacterium]|nr:GNAT family N-acetyltransferase [Calditrichota bacterium]
ADIVYPYLKLPGGVDAYLGSLSKGTRRYFRRYKKQFIEQGGSFEKLTGGQITEKDVQDYLDLHFQRWHEESAALNDVTRAFHLESSLKMAGLNQFTLFFAKHNGARIAAHSCFDIGKRREGYFTGREPEKEELRAGRLLYMETILDAIEEGFTEYNFGYGGDSYKLSFTDTVGKTVHFLLAAKGNMPNLEKLYPKYELLHLNAERQD